MAHFLLLSLPLLWFLLSPALCVTCPGVDGFCAASFPGQVCNVVCSRGRPSVPLCQKDGTWTGQPRCIEHEPGKDEQVAGVCIGVPGYCSLSFYGNRCKLKCPRGPPIDSVCSKDGTWEPYPTCLGDVRDTQDGCDHCPGPNGKFRNRTAEAILGIGPPTRGNEISQQTSPQAGPFNQNSKSGSRIGGSRPKIIISPSKDPFQSQQNSQKSWRDDGRCGRDYLLPNGQPAQCNPSSESCCAPSGWCGHTDDHCLCEECVSYAQGSRISPIVPRGQGPPVQTSSSKTWRDDARCGSEFPLPNGQPAQCNPSSDSCCAASGWCGHTQAHCKCETCVDYSSSRFPQNRPAPSHNQAPQPPRQQDQEQTRFISQNKKVTFSQTNIQSPTHQGVQPRPSNFYPVNNINPKTTPKTISTSQGRSLFQSRPTPAKTTPKPFIKPEPIPAVPNPSPNPGNPQQTFGIFPAVNLANPEAGVFDEPRVPRVQQDQNSENFYGVFQEVQLKR